MQAKILPYYTSTTRRSGQKVKKIFFSEGHVALKEKEWRALGKFDLMHTPESQTLKLFS